MPEDWQTWDPDGLSDQQVDAIYEVVVSLGETPPLPLPPGSATRWLACSTFLRLWQRREIIMLGNSVIVQAEIDKARAAKERV